MYIWSVLVATAIPPQHVYKLGHTLYTGASLATAWPLLVQYTGTAWPLLVHVLYNKSGHCLYTRGILLGYFWYTIPVWDALCSQHFENGSNNGHVT